MENRFTTPQVAAALGLSAAHIRRMITQGTAKPIESIGGSWLFTAEEIERLRTRPKSKSGRPKGKSALHKTE